ncbi:Hypothetical_protein [Hexamita inflata]|uniref:Hypothetical_protein n=1 Tax=Hexamita inflata TaxID=28002 RepID=A0ABP1HPU6_9EUKA
MFGYKQGAVPLTEYYSRVYSKEMNPLVQLRSRVQYIVCKLWSGNNLNEQWLEKQITDQRFIESISANERMNDLYLQQQWQNQVQLNSQIQKLCKFNSIHKHVRTQFSLQSQLFSGQVSGLEASLKYKMTQCNCTLQNINQQISELSNKFIAYSEK